MKQKYQIFLYLGLLILFSSLVSSKTNFTGVEDVLNNAEVTQIIINLTNSSQEQLNLLYNLSNGYLVNYTIDRISQDKASRIKVDRWIWYNFTFYEINPIIFRDEYIININLTFDKPFLIGKFENLIEQENCENVKLSIELNETKIKKDYPDITPAAALILEWTDNEHREQRVPYENEEYYFNHDVCLVHEGNIYPWDSYFVNFTVWGEYRVPEICYDVPTVGRACQPGRTSQIDEPKKIYWGKLEEYNSSLPNKVSDTFNITAKFKDYNINIIQKRKNIDLFFWGLFIYYLFFLLYCVLYVKNILVEEMNTNKRYGKKLFNIIITSFLSIALPIILFSFDQAFTFIISPSIFFFIPAPIITIGYFILRKKRILK